jgi:hypothetical protein
MSTTHGDPWAEVKRLQVENDALKSSDASKTASIKWMLGQNVRDQLEIAHLKSQLAATEEALAQVQRESRELRRENETAKYRATVIADTAFEARYEAMRKVADAANRWASATDPHSGLNALCDLRDVVDEYRALTEPPAKQPAVDAVPEESASAK